MSTIYRHDGAYGEQATGTREWFRRALAPLWAEWHREATAEAADYAAGEHSQRPEPGITPDMDLDAYIDASLDNHLIAIE